MKKLQKLSATGVLVLAVACSTFAGDLGGDRMRAGDLGGDYAMAAGDLGGDRATRGDLGGDSALSGDLGGDVKAFFMDWLYALGIL